MEFIKNILEVEVDGLRGVNHYTIKAMYNEEHEDDFSTIEFKVIDELDYTWAQINHEGGIGKVIADIKACYNIDLLKQRGNQFLTN